MSYSISSGQIAAGLLYLVEGSGGTVTYHGITYAVGDRFNGVAGDNAYTATGNAVVTEATRISGFVVDMLQQAEDTFFSQETLRINGMSIDFSLNDEEKIVSDKSAVKGFAVELIDYPFYSFAITETRL